MVQIVDVDTYSRDRFNKEDSLSKFLVPYLYATDLDDAAEKFLVKYYREALETPVPVDVDELGKTIDEAMRLVYQNRCP